MEARDRTISVWFNFIRQRQIALPRFQRREAWGHHEVADLLTTVLRGLPAGALLVLQVGETIPFHYRTLVDSPEEGERIIELLLDGQQRLTALWKSLNDLYEDRTYLIRMPSQDTASENQPLVVGISRWVREGRKYPRWVDEPVEVFGRGYLPIRLLVPGDERVYDEIDSWLEKAMPDEGLRRQLRNQVFRLREKVSHFNLPFLYLPPDTPKDVAVDVFIKMNTSGIDLSTFDIIVAQVEDAVGESMLDLVGMIKTQHPDASAYKDMERVVLDVAALLQDRPPNQAGYWGLNLSKMVSDWDLIVRCIGEMVSFLEDEKVFDGQRLPTDAVLAVVAALARWLPDQPDRRGNARVWIRKYLWRSFLTGRYAQAAATAALQDYRAMRDLIAGKHGEESVPIFDEDKFPLPNESQLLGVGWPKGKNILARGILALSLRCGAVDIADGAPVTRQTIRSREYHHLFPAAFLREGGLNDEDIYRALNCALVTWRTNRTVSAKEPVKYLRERAEAGVLGQDELVRRLATHLIPARFMEQGATEHVEPRQRPDHIRTTYQTFLEARARILRRAVMEITAGREFEGTSLVAAEGGI